MTAYSSILTDYLGQGTAASRPSAPPIAATALSFWFSTDTGELDLWNTNTGAWVTVIVTEPTEPTLGQITATAIVANAQLGTVSLPANAVILYALFRETAGHNVSVGLGTTSGGTDVLGAQAVTASKSLNVPAATFSKDWFSAGSAQAIYVTSASWGSASINVFLVYQIGP